MTQYDQHLKEKTHNFAVAVNSLKTVKNPGYQTTEIMLQKCKKMAFYKTEFSCFYFTSYIDHLYAVACSGPDFNLQHHCNTWDIFK